MRDIKFRGKSIDDGEWVYGSLHVGTKCWITRKSRDEARGLAPFRPIDVDPETVAQYTGLKDKNGKEIYEGDICRDSNNTIVEIVWSEKHQWACKIIKGCTLSKGLIFPLWHWDNCEDNAYRQLEVIGNIYGNSDITINKI